MCTQIAVEGADGVETFGQLCALVGRENIVIGPTMPVDQPFEDDECLCHVDAEATAERAGFTCRPGWDERSCEYIWERKPT